MPDTKGSDNAGDQVSASAMYTMACAQLCNIAYDYFHLSMPVQIATPGVINKWEDGTWACVWGPSNNPDDANLALVAKFTPTDTGKLPTYVVVIRGTDPLVTLSGIEEQLKEDLEIRPQDSTAFPGAGPDVKIASGTNIGLNKIKSLTDPNQSDGSQTLSDFLVNEIGKYPGQRPTVVVTGHSLGGCLTTVVAPYLLGEFQKHYPAPKILPYTFAGPSAGNAAFASYYDTTFPENYRYFNSYDIIPHWWASPREILSIYPGIPIEWYVKDFFDAKIDEIEKYELSYVQPSSGVELDSSMIASFSWKEQAAHQHHIATYIALLKQP